MTPQRSDREDLEGEGAAPSRLYDRAEVQRWMLEDPDPATAEEVAGLLAAAEGGDGAAAKELADRFQGPLRFGTAGLRGALGGGPHRMNRAVVIKAAAGLSNYLRSALPEGFRLIVGYDGRRGSRQFALDTAAVAQAAGGAVQVFKHPVPTPLVAFALRELGADAAVVVTASHNPASDNGYKVYLGGPLTPEEGRGAQIVAPTDREIFHRILSVPSATEVPRAEGGWEWLGEGPARSYLHRIGRLVAPGPRNLRIVTTALHGVSGPALVAALQQVGFTDIHPVREQQDPDPDFPTVTFPNPEEPGTLDLAADLGRTVGADLVIATDPDGDRCAAMIPSPGTPAGWRALSGNQVGALLGQQAAKEHSGRPGAVLANSLVSSRLLARIAAHHGVGYQRTLTGFKWIARVPGLVYGFEEALGYCADPAHVRDKDGISAAVKLAVLAAEQKEAGRTLGAALDDLDREFGCHMTEPLTFRLDDPSEADLALTQLRGARWSQLAGSPIVVAADLAEGYDGLPPTEGVLFLTAASDQVVVRPSGTEPKLKAYLEVIIPVVDGDLAAARQAGSARLATLKTELRAGLGL